MEIFNRFNKWPSSNILLITGSKGKTTISKILKKLGKIIFLKIYYLDRKKILFSNFLNTNLVISSSQKLIIKH